VSHNIVNVVEHVLHTEARDGQPLTVERIAKLTGMSKRAVKACLAIIASRNEARP
jgi:DNA-binding GntR family transcriptional regulator